MHVLYIGKVPSQLIPNKKMGILIQRTVRLTVAILGFEYTTIQFQSNSVVIVQFRKLMIKS